MSVNLKLLPQLDELTRQIRILAEPCEREFLEFARSQEKWRLEWVHLLEQYDRLKLLADEYKAKLQDSEKKLSVARKLLEEEQNKRRAVEQESLKLEKQLEVVRDAVFQGKGNDETKEKLAFLNNTSVRSRRSFGRCDTQRLNTISEALDSTGSILSDLGCTHSEDELDTSLLCSRRPWKNFRAPKAEEGPSIKRVRRSADKKSFEAAELRAAAGEHLVATTTVMVERDGPITAYSTIDTGAGPDKENHGPKHSHNHNSNGVSSVRIENLRFPGTISQRSSPTTSPVVINYPPNKFNNRPHAFTNRTMLTPDTCGVCGSKIKFAKVVVRCKECRITCHMECKNQAPLPCIPVGNTPTKKGFIGTIADFTPPLPPMVPAIVVHCVQEVEQRGLGEVGVYRVSGSDRDVKALKEKFLRGKGVPNISGVDIHVVCGTVKDFLRSLKEPLVTHVRWQDFVRAADTVDPDDSRAAMYQVVSSLPQPNRDTLAFLVLHLQRVAEWPECKMPMENLAKVFGPTVVGYSSSEIDGAALVRETKKQVAVMQLLMSLPSEYWARFLKVDPDTQALGDALRHTPSTRSLAARSSSSSVCRGYFASTPGATMPAYSRHNKLFDTPPVI